MNIKSVEFIQSAVEKEQYPNDLLPEIVLSGRSNVGKSSFINSILEPQLTFRKKDLIK